MKETPFDKNIEKWSAAQPKFARMLPYIDTNLYFFTQTTKKELNLAKGVEDNYQEFHDTHGAEEEAARWFASLDLSKALVLFVYGVGLGYYYDAARAWLKKNNERCLVFLEDDACVIAKLFETERATRLLRDKQVQIHYFRDFSEQEEIFDQLYWDFSLTRLVISGLAYYVENKKEDYERLGTKIAYDAAVKNALVHEYLRFGGSFFINYYQNVLELPHSYLGNKFFHQYKEVPAIICGAGPSLEKNISLVKELQDKALIFAGGSATNVVNAAGFQPHFGAGIDPNRAQLERLSANQAYEVPYFYRNRMFHDAFMTITGPRLYITGAGGYDIAEYFEEQLGIEGELIEEGHNVVNFCLEIAYAMGCNPIIFVGMDLAFTNQKAYAPGVVQDLSMDSNRIMDEEDDDAQVLLRKDVNGESVYTLWKWIAEADWMGEFAKHHPDVTLINATEGGIGFPGIPNSKLEKVARDYLHRTYDLFNRVHADTQNSEMKSLTEDKVDQAMIALRKSLSQCRNYFSILIEENEKNLRKLEEEKQTITVNQSGRAALAETELAEEPAYRYICEIFNAVYMRILTRKYHLLKRPGKKETQWKRQIKRLLLNNKRLLFLRDVAQVNAELIDYAFKER